MLNPTGSEVTPKPQAHITIHTGLMLGWAGVHGLGVDQAIIEGMGALYRHFVLVDRSVAGAGAASHAEHQSIADRETALRASEGQVPVAIIELSGHRVAHGCPDMAGE